MREQIKAINKELGEDDEIAEAIEEYRQMKEHTYPEYVTEALERIKTFRTYKSSFSRNGSNSKLY